MAKGDSIKIITKGGPPELGVSFWEIQASQNGRTVDMDFTKEGGLQWLEVKEMTRGGSTVQRALFLVSEVVSVTRRAKGE